MTIFEALILGILQGIAEFIPISSSGHLLLLQRIFGIEDNLFTFSIVVHVGTLIPVLLIYFNRLRGLIAKPFQKLTWLLVLGTIPTVIVALLLGDVIDALFSGDFLLFGFLITAIILLTIDTKKTGTKDITEITYKNAIMVGLMQAVAIVPGISRSGSTIFGAVSQGINKKSAANFSFLLSIPAIVGATVLEIMSIIQGTTYTGFIISAPVVIGFFASMISGYFAIKIMLKLVVSSKLKYFAYYLIGISGLIALDQMVFNIVF